MGLFSRSKPKIKIQVTKKDSYSGWIKCSGCHEMIHANQLQDNLHCCPKCSYHYRLSIDKRIDLLLDEGSFKELFTELMPTDPLSFIDSMPYYERIEKAKQDSGKTEGAIVGLGKIFNRPVAFGALDFSFMGGSMGSVVGEKITCIIEHAAEKELPLILVSASGGARMQESVLSLMQMAKTSAALALMEEKSLPYISILTNPTTGGVTASFASLGDIIIAEPDALIAFAGPRVVKQTIGQDLPPGAQKSEFLLEKGMIDAIVSRQDLKKKVHYYLDIFTPDESKSTEKLKELVSLDALSKAKV